MRASSDESGFEARSGRWLAKYFQPGEMEPSLWFNIWTLIMSTTYLIYDSYINKNKYFILPARLTNIS